MNEPIKVRIVREDNGCTVYNRVLDRGGDVLFFESTFGHYSRRELARNGLKVVEGWLTRAEMDAEIEAPL